jgi:hypothetical protein
MVHTSPDGDTELQPNQLTVVAPPVGVAVNMIAVPFGKFTLHVDGQLIPNGELVTVPVPEPEKFTARTGSEPPPVPVKQTTFAVILPGTIAPDEDMPPALLLVVTVAVIREPPQKLPVAVIRPVELTVTICGVFEAQTAWSVISLVTRGVDVVAHGLDLHVQPRVCAHGYVCRPEVFNPRLKVNGYQLLVVSTTGQTDHSKHSHDDDCKPVSLPIHHFSCPDQESLWNGVNLLEDP